MNREPIFDELADDLSRDMRQHHPRHAAPVTFDQDRRHLPIFAATVKTLGWNGLHMPPAVAIADETAVFEAIR